MPQTHRSERTTARRTGAGFAGLVAAGLVAGLALPAAAQGEPTTTTAPPSSTTTTTTAPPPTTTAPTTTTPTTAPSAATAPEGWTGGSGWVAFTFGKTALGQNHKGEWWGPVTITRHSGGGFDLESGFSNWDSRPSSANPAVTEYGWPEEWQLGGLVLRRVRWCDRAATTCDYRVMSGATGERLFFAAGSPAGDYAGYDQGPVTLEGTVPVLDIVFSWDPSTSVTPAAGSTPGKLTLDASGTTDQMSGDLSFAWTVTNQDTGQQFQGTGPIATFDLDTNGSYCVAVTVTNADDPDNPATYGVTAPDCKPISNVAPGTTPGPGPGNGGGAGGGTGGGGAGGGVNVVFAPPRRGSSALTGTAGGDSVVWLWRPEFFQPGEETTQALPQTGRNPLEGRTDIVVATDPAPDSNAAPMLAGLGIFGVVGVGWLFTRRRRLRAEY